MPSTRAQPLQPSDPRQPAPRIAINQVARFPGVDITVVAKPVTKLADGHFKMTCVLCGDEFEVRNILNEDQVSVIMELTLRPGAFGPGTYGLVSSGMLNDDFNESKYRELAALISQGKYTHLFY
jgi:hypothetical protein